MDDPNKGNTIDLSIATDEVTIRIRHMVHARAALRVIDAARLFVDAVEEASRASDDAGIPADDPDVRAAVAATRSVFQQAAEKMPSIGIFFAGVPQVEEVIGIADAPSAEEEGT